MRLISNRKTLAGQLAILIALAFAISAALFITADRISTKAIGKYLEASSYVERQNDMYAENSNDDYKGYREVATQEDFDKF